MQDQTTLLTKSSEQSEEDEVVHVQQLMPVMSFDAFKYQLRQRWNAELNRTLCGLLHVVVKKPLSWPLC